MESYAFWRPSLRTLTFEDIPGMTKQGTEITCMIIVMIYLDIKMHPHACVSVSMGASCEMCVCVSFAWKYVVLNWAWSIYGSRCSVTAQKPARNPPYQMKLFYSKLLCLPVAV